MEEFLPLTTRLLFPLFLGIIFISTFTLELQNKFPRVDPVFTAIEYAFSSEAG